MLLIGAAAALVGHVVWALQEGRDVLGRELPFGPYLAAAIWIIWLYGPITAG